MLATTFDEVIFFNADIGARTIATRIHRGGMDLAVYQRLWPDTAQSDFLSRQDKVDSNTPVFFRHCYRRCTNLNPSDDCKHRDPTPTITTWRPAECHVLGIQMADVADLLSLVLVPIYKTDGFASSQL